MSANKIPSDLQWADLVARIKAKADSSSLSTVATSGSYTDLSNKPTIPTVNDSTITIQKNSATIDTFTTNASSNKTINITVPTNNNELANGAGYQTATDVSTAISTAISSTFTYKGTKANYSDLPSSGNKTGDVWNITNADSTHGIKAGDNVAWTGSDWDVLGGTTATFTGATSSAAGTSGLVPAPASGDNTKFLCGDGTWSSASYSLPTASASTLGGIKVGTNLTINASTGVLSADAQVAEFTAQEWTNLWAD